MIRVTEWNEFRHELEEGRAKEIYPGGIHEAVKSFLQTESDFSVRTATLDMPECGLTEEVLAETDVLTWWGHMAHNEVPDEIVERVQNAVLRGMGHIVMHSGHHSKIFRRLMGTGCDLQWRDNDRERIWCCDPSHPIAAGLPPYFELEHEEMYGEPFTVPDPDATIFIGWFAGGEVFRSGCTFRRGFGKIFYFQPGHEGYPIYYDENVQKIIKNAVKWADPLYRADKLESPNAIIIPERREK